MAYTEVFLAMGIDEISVAPAIILPLRSRIRTLDIREKEKILKKYGCLN